MKDETEALLALGSNVGDRRAHIEGALAGLRAAGGIRISAVSSIVETEPVGPPQPPFLNCAVLVATTLSPFELLDLCLSLERAAGRKRTVRWGPRTLDVDIILYGDVVLQTKRLTLPHPRFREREFVLAPAAQIAGDRRDPVTGKSLSCLLTEIRTRGRSACAPDCRDASG